MIRFDPLTTPLGGKSLIEASAGTGKTYTIASLYQRLVIEQGLSPENILVVTFTEAATKELRDRIRQRLRQARSFFSGDFEGDDLLIGIASRVTAESALARIDMALQQFDAASIATIHGFCAGVLNENRFETGSLFDTELVTEQNTLLCRIIDDYWRAAFFGDNSQLLDPVKRRKLTPGRLVKLLDRKVQNPFTRILPDDRAFSAEILDSRVTALYKETGSLWQTERGRIIDLLNNCDALTRNEKSYRHDLLPAIHEGMDRYMEGGNPYALFPEFDKLTLEMINRETKKNHDSPHEPLFELCGSMADLVSRRVTTFIVDAAAHVRREQPLLKERLNIRGYDDLLTDLLTALDGEQGERLAALLRGRYQAALIDEFQDTDQIQFRILDRIYGGSSLPLFLIGDPKQAIYSFRGADLFAYINAKRAVDADCRYSIDTNWRSTGQMVKAVNHLFLQQQLPFIHGALEFHPVHAADVAGEADFDGFDPAPLQLWFFSRKVGERQINKGDGVKRVSMAVAAEISALLAASADGRAVVNGRPLAPEDIAVIVRTHNQADAVRDELSQLSVPAVVNSGKSIFSTVEAAELAQVISALANPSRETLLRGALATSIFGYHADQIYRLVVDEAAWEERVATFNSYRELWLLRGFMVMYRTLLKNEGVHGRLLALPSGERRLTNLQQAAEILHSHEVSARRGLQRLVAWFCEQIAGVPENDEYQLRLESDDSAVKIVTIHLSKGLEYPVVFAPFSWGGVMMDGEQALCHIDGQQVADFGSDDFAANSLLAMSEGLSENLRLLYVAVTRAKYRCYLAWGRFKDCELSALAYLFHYRPANESDPLKSLRENMAKIDDGGMVDDLQRFVATACGSSSLTIDPVALSTASLPSPPLEALPHYRIFSGEINRRWRIASFSSLVSGHRGASELPDRDMQTSSLPGALQDSAALSIFAFPRGAQAGTLLHDILEELDFERVDENYYLEIARRHLEKAGLQAKWLPVVATMLRNVMTSRLGKEGVRLKDIPAKAKRSELEFIFPMKLVEVSSAMHLLSDESGPAPALKSLAAMLNFREQEGALLGFVDLVFGHGGKYYIVDWKSNHLGDSLQDYTEQRIEGEMSRHLYTLQYLLYTVALHRYLKMRLPAYNYGEHFGGVYYLFVRGMDPAVPGNGVFFDRPAESLVTRLEGYFADDATGGADG